MPSLKSLIAVILFVLSIESCRNTTPLIAKDLTNENERNNTLVVFVGEKISVTPIPYESQLMGGALVMAKYKILQRVYGDYKPDTIEFEAYDHYGRFPFANYKNVLLFVSQGKNTGKYYQEEYQYFDVYKAKNGQWASSYKAREYKNPKEYYTAVKPEIINFDNEVSYPTRVKDESGKYEEVTYPSPYYETVGEKAIAIYGNYIEDLFRLKKEGVLTARGLFGEKKDETFVQEVGLAPFYQVPPYKTTIGFLTFWNGFARSVNHLTNSQFRQLALDSLYSGKVVVTADSFYNNCFHEVFDKEFAKKFTDTLSAGFYVSRADEDKMLLCAAKRIEKDDGDYIIRKVQVTRQHSDEEPWLVTFSFIKTTDGYRFYGYDYTDGWATCP